MLSDKQPIVEKGKIMVDYEIERKQANAKKEVWKAVQKAYEEIDNLSALGMVECIKKSRPTSSMKLQLRQ